MVACNFSSRSSVPRIGITPRTNTRRVDFSHFDSGVRNIRANFKPEIGPGWKL